MKLLKYLFTSIIILFLAFSKSICTNTNLTVEEIIKKIDELYRSKSSFAKIEMEIVTPYWERTLKIDAWSEGMKKTFFRILYPKKERGVATLRIGNEMWNYLPKANKVIKIPPSMMMNSWMGSDFTNDDLVKESSMFEDYYYKIVTPKDEKENIVHIELKPKEDKPIVWAKIVIAAYLDTYIPIWEKYYDEKDRVVRVLNFTDVKTFDNKKIPSVLEMIPQNKEGYKTVIKYLELEFDIPVSKNIFTLRNLRSKQ